ncbi:hypothetical protein VSX61_01255 [Brenneria populi subsp. brevivirga]|nr:hypothetical protein [Brenneria populi subsp. brevivirga]
MHGKPGFFDVDDLLKRQGDLGDVGIQVFLDVQAGEAPTLREHR